MHVSEYDESCMLVDRCLACISDASGRQRLGLTEAVGPAGATTGLNCSLCEAGTYGTGSGQDRLMDIDLLDPSVHDCDKDQQYRALDV